MARPSAALLKATLICGARRLALPYVPGNPMADNHQGFGRVDLDAVLAPPAPVQFGFADITPGLRTGELQERNIEVKANAARPLRVVLAYSDCPGFGLKNNLNLLLIGPDGKHYVGNGSGSSVILPFDVKNNVEKVEIAEPAAGTWRVQVIGGNVPEGPKQPYSLAWLAPN